MKISNKIWVIGNGESRKGFALNGIKDYTIGCNAIHRDFICDEYVAVDRRMVNELLKNEKNQNKSIWTRKEWIEKYNKSPSVKQLPELPFNGTNKVDQAFHWNSGPFAIYLACLYNPKEIHLLGFDLYGIAGLMNNVYKDSVNYAKQTDRATAEHFWVYQLSKLFELYPEIEFKQHQRANWKIPKEWMVHKNLTLEIIRV